MSDPIVPARGCAVGLVVAAFLWVAVLVALAVIASWVLR